MLVRKFRRSPSVARYSPTSVCSRRPSASGGLRCGRQFHCRPSLRRPGLSMPRLILSLGTKCHPSAFYRRVLAQRELWALAVPLLRTSSSLGSQQCNCSLIGAVRASMRDSPLRHWLHARQRQCLLLPYAPGSTVGGCCSSQALSHPKLVPCERLCRGYQSSAHSRPSSIRSRLQQFVESDQACLDGPKWPRIVVARRVRRPHCLANLAQRASAVAVLQVEQVGSRLRAGSELTGPPWREFHETSTSQLA